MADTKISALTSASTPLAGTEVLPIVQSSTTVKASIANIQSAPISAGFANGVQYLNGSKVPTTSSNLSFDGTQLGVQQTSPGSYWSDARQLVIGDHTTGVGITIAPSSSTNGNIYFAKSTTGGGPYQGYITYGMSTDSLQFATNQTERMRLTSTGLTINTGNLVIGTSGKGIDFSATSDASGMTSELLADYEEGTWTPTDASGAGLSLTVNSATYTKIGNTVRVQAQVTYPSTASGASALWGGLPYTSANYSIGAVRDSAGVTALSTCLSTSVYFHAPTNVSITNVEFSSATVFITNVYVV